MSKFGFRSVEHAFATVARDVVVGARGAAAVAGKLSAAAPEVEAITELLDPPAVVFERAAFAALGTLAKACNDSVNVATDKGLNLALDAETIADFKQVYAMLASRLEAIAKLPAASDGHSEQPTAFGKAVA